MTITFRFIAPGFSDTDFIYTGTVVEKFINGYKVERFNESAIVLFEDIEIIEISE